jgi:hypothetical protein
MQRKHTGWMKARAAMAACGLLISVGLAGCGKGEGADAGKKPNTGPAKTGTAAKTAPSIGTGAAGTGAGAKPVKFLSVFSTNDSRDPFHPKLKPKAVAAATQANAVPEPNQIVSALEAGFSGTVGSGDEYVALVYGVLLEKNRETTLTLNVGGAPRRVKVKPLRIFRTTVELQVEGIQQPVTITKRR